jgi:hypothetical protein
MILEPFRSSMRSTLSASASFLGRQEPVADDRVRVERPVVVVPLELVVQDDAREVCSRRPLYALDLTDVERHRHLILPSEFDEGAHGCTCE